MSGWGEVKSTFNNGRLSFEGPGTLHLVQVRQVGCPPGDSCSHKWDLLECFHPRSSWFNPPGFFRCWSNLHNCLSIGDPQLEWGRLNCQLCRHCSWLHPPRRPHLGRIHWRHPDLLHCVWAGECLLNFYCFYWVSCYAEMLMMMQKRRRINFDKSKLNLFLEIMNVFKHASLI